jgi:coenzyme PQQ precursor peptide PqqA
VVHEQAGMSRRVLLSVFPDLRSLTSLEGVQIDRAPPSFQFVEVNFTSREKRMKWKTPIIIEVAVGLEINAYA